MIWQTQIIHLKNEKEMPRWKFLEQVFKEFKVIELINGYRTRGHLFTKTNPVRTQKTLYTFP